MSGLASGSAAWHRTLPRRLGLTLSTVTLLALAWALLIITTGGFRVELGALRLSSRTPHKALGVALVTAAALLVLHVFRSRGELSGRSPDITEAGHAARRFSAIWIAQTTFVLAVIVGYFAYVFRLGDDGIVLKSGLSDWLDPYFINFLHEHWLRSLLSLSDPASPPMYFPATGTLGYSHGLVMFAPFYALARIFFDPFPANTVALFVMMIVGSFCLYHVFRTVAQLAFHESLLLSAFFFSSANVINIGTAHWAQRASVFLIPPVVLIAARSITMADGRRRAATAAAAGFLASLLLTQDAYTALFAILLCVLVAVPWLLSSSARQIRATLVDLSRTAAGKAFFLGTYVGLLVFAWCYADSYMAHPQFPEEHLIRQLVARDPAAWDSPGDIIRALTLYDSPRVFFFALGIGAVAWWPGSRAGWSARVLASWLLCATAVVLLVPFQFGEFSLWRSVFAPLPGLAIIRDPRRIVYVYELVAVAVAAWLMARLPVRSIYRMLLAGLLAVLLTVDPTYNTFRYRRAVHAFNYWVQAPIAIDPSCESFFMKTASQDYMSRFDNMWGLYSIDAMFIAVKTSIPTLNGYSAWGPPGWAMAQPHEPGYMEAVDGWIVGHGLRNVCALDIDRRTMSPYQPPTPVPAPQ